MDCSLLGFSVHGILLARILEWVAVPPLQGIFPTQGSNLGLLHGRRILYHLSCKGSPGQSQDSSHNSCPTAHPAFTVRAILPGCWVTMSSSCWFTHCFSIAFLSWSPNASDLHWRPFKYFSETSPFTLSLSTPASSFAHKVPPAAGVPSPPGMDETMALESGSLESNRGSTISLTCDPGAVSKPCLSFLICKVGIIMSISRGWHVNTSKTLKQYWIHSKHSINVASCHYSSSSTAMNSLPLLNPFSRTSLVVQWLRLCLPMQGMWVQSL